LAEAPEGGALGHREVPFACALFMADHSSRAQIRLLGDHRKNATDESVGGFLYRVSEFGR
jgi:hypothetical protein